MGEDPCCDKAPDELYFGQFLDSIDDFTVSFDDRDTFNDGDADISDIYTYEDHLFSDD